MAQLSLGDVSRKIHTFETLCEPYGFKDLRCVAGREQHVSIRLGMASGCKTRVARLRGFKD